MISTKERSFKWTINSKTNLKMAIIAVKLNKQIQNMTTIMYYRKVGIGSS